MILIIEKPHRGAVLQLEKPLFFLPIGAQHTQWRSRWSRNNIMSWRLPKEDVLFSHFKKMTAETEYDSIVCAQFDASRRGKNMLNYSNSSLPKELKACTIVGRGGSARYMSPDLGHEREGNWKRSSRSPL